MYYRPMVEPHGLAHNPFKALVAPRPIAWVSTLDSAGRANLAPFSFFNAVAESPPILMFAAYGKKQSEPTEKDTPRNVIETGEFVVNIVPYALREAMNITAGPYAADVDEFEKAGLIKAPSREIKPPRVQDSPVSFECQFLTRTKLPSADPAYENGAIFGQVVGINIDDAVIKDGMVDIRLIRPLCRLGYMDYTSVVDVFDMPRPTS